MKNELVLYRPDEVAEHIEVRLEHDTVWLNRHQLAQLFDRDVKTIGKHIVNILNEELEGLSVVAKFATTAADGKVYQTEHYNLDVIISVGYRVKSRRGIQFRMWANQVLKEYLLRGYTINHRMNRLEDGMEGLKERMEQVEILISSQQLPTQGVFFEGQVYDAYALISRLIRSAQKSILVIDNYIDDSVLTHLSKKARGVEVQLFTKRVSKQLQLDVDKINQQYGDFQIILFTQSHDRFLIIDEKEVYHLGASLKDLGKKWFAFSKMSAQSVAALLQAIHATRAI
jgi:hypothetical protein